MMENKYISPKINSISWGKIETEDHKHYKDAKLFPGGSREWDWNETGTRHVPGIQPADVEELLEKGAKTVILSKGYHERLQICDETIEFLDKKGVSHFILQTEQAVKKYNDLADDHAIGALIHSTC